jgi:hypothetical protein
MWEAGKSVSDYTKGTTHDALLEINPSLAFVEDFDGETERKADGDI